MTTIFNSTASKGSANLIISSDLLRHAKEQHLKLSQSQETQFVIMLPEIKCRQWQEENGEAIKDYNRRIDSKGTFSDGLRHF